MSTLLNQIYLGWRNRLFPPEKLKEMIGLTSLERMKICEDCEYHSKLHSTPLRPDDHCVHCGCNLAAKTKCLSCACPLPTPKWEAIMTLGEEKKLLSNYGKKE